MWSQSANHHAIAMTKKTEERSLPRMGFADFLRQHSYLSTISVVSLLILFPRLTVASKIQASNPTFKRLQSTSDFDGGRGYQNYHATACHWGLENGLNFSK